MNETNDKEILNQIVSYLNDHYNQDSENYSIFQGAKPDVFKYSDHIAISLWACGAIVCIESIMYFLQEDDGNWFVIDDGMQSSFSVSWIDSFTNALQRLKKYTEENGTPVYYSGLESKIICHYTL